MPCIHEERSSPLLAATCRHSLLLTSIAVTLSHPLLLTATVAADDELDAALKPLRVGSRRAAGLGSKRLARMERTVRVDLERGDVRLGRRAPEREDREAGTGRQEARSGEGLRGRRSRGRRRASGYGSARGSCARCRGTAANLEPARGARRDGGEGPRVRRVAVHVVVHRLIVLLAVVVAQRPHVQARALLAQGKVTHHAPPFTMPDDFLDQGAPRCERVPPRQRAATTAAPQPAERAPEAPTTQAHVTASRALG